MDKAAFPQHGMRVLQTHGLRKARAAQSGPHEGLPQPLQAPLVVPRLGIKGADGPNRDLCVPKKNPRAWTKLLGCLSLSRDVLSHASAWGINSTDREPPPGAEGAGPTQMLCTRWGLCPRSLVREGISLGAPRTPPPPDCALPAGLSSCHPQVPAQPIPLPGGDVCPPARILHLQPPGTAPREGRVQRGEDEGGLGRVQIVGYCSA